MPTWSTATARLPTLFLVDYDTPGLRAEPRPGLHAHLRRPPPAVRPRGRPGARPRPILGGVGQADELTNEWFVEERIHIGARCTGAMERLLDAGRRVGHASGSSSAQRIYDFQGVSFPLADSAADAAAARLLTRECAWLADSGADPKVVHAKASIAKLFASEAAFRCADRVVQVFGGRGYMREYPAERFFRELRVDRIWEGTSEIQRLIIARALEKRGVEPGRRRGMTDHRPIRPTGARSPISPAAGPTRRRSTCGPLRPALDRGRRRVAAIWIAETVRDNLRDDGQRRPAATSSTRSTTRLYGQPCYPSLDALPERPDMRPRRAQPAAGGERDRRGGRGAACPARHHPGWRRGRGRSGGRRDAGRGRARSPAPRDRRSSARTAWA